MWSCCVNAVKTNMVTIVTILAAAAAWFDLRKNIIPNRLVFPGIGIGIFLRCAIGILDGNSPDILAMAAEITVLFICLWPFYAMGGLGAGDCKLLLLAGVFLPAKQAIFVVVSTFFIAAVQIVLSGKRKTIPLAPAFFVAALAGSLWEFAGR